MQIDNRIKRLRVNQSLVSFTSLQRLFVENFHYFPGSGGFPPIYVKDPRHGVFYELNDSADITDGAHVRLGPDGYSLTVTM
jgi:hypothetical protein